MMACRQSRTSRANPIYLPCKKAVKYFIVCAMSHDQNEDMKTRFSLRSDTAVPRIPADMHAVITVCPVKSEPARLSLSVGTGLAEPRAAHPCSSLVTWTRFPKRDTAVFNAQNHSLEKTLATLVESSCLQVVS